VATGDLGEILQRRVFRLIVPWSRTHFSLDRGREMGVAAEFGREFETWLNKRRPRGSLPVVVAFVPLPRDRMVPALLRGRGDAISANLTITPERAAIVDFAPPWLRDVAEILVTGPAAPALEGLESLSGREVHVRASSSYFGHLDTVNRGFALRGLPPIKVVPISERLQDEDILQMVNVGLLPWAVVDDHVAGIWSRLLPNLVMRPDIAINLHGDIAWALRKGSPQLAAALAEFFATRRDDSSFGATILRRYFVNPAALRNAGAARDAQRFAGLVESFRAHGGTHGFDHLMLAAQGYQESQLDQSRRSHRGAVGVMQLMPATAAAPPVSIPDVARSADRNILAGARYMAHLRDRYLADPALSEVDRVLMTFAAYNAGPGNLRRFRAEAQRMGLDPNVWFNNVEQAAARILGYETVQYVGNIYKYYIAYTLAERRAAEAASP
jgi:membrane-bound lytic murein transglycosylase MltF